MEISKLRYNVADYRKKRVIIDTDAACEADDPFAIAHALMSRMLDVKGICAEHFVEEGSMDRSLDVIKRITEAMSVEVPILHGQTGKLKDHGDEALSEAAQFIIDEAMKDTDEPLYVLCIGAITNVARALQENLTIAERMTVVWIGGNPYGCETPSWEFNSGNDVDAANIVLGSGAEVWQIPNSVYGTMHIGFAEIQKRIAPYGEIGHFLYDNLVKFYESDRATWSAGESWSLGDSPAVGVTLEPNCGGFKYVHAPLVLEDTSYAYPDDTPLIRVYTSINSRFIIEDFINKLQVLFG